MNRHVAEVTRHIYKIPIAHITPNRIRSLGQSCWVAGVGIVGYNDLQHFFQKTPSRKNRYRSKRM
jgi:hypothetical protein